MNPARPPQLWLLRHAQPLIDPGTCYGRRDVAADAALTATAACAWLRAAPPAYVLRHSPLQRCAQLATLLHTTAPDGITAVHTDARLQEMDFGQWEGQRWDALPQGAIDAWAQDLAHTPPGGGEALWDMLARVRAALRDSWQHDSQHGQRDVLWVTHAGVIRCVHWLLWHGDALPRSATWQLPAPALGQHLALPWDTLRTVCAPADR